jgi:mRNA interferase RelE/StbE
LNASPWRVELTRTALRDLRRLDVPVRQRISTALAALAEDPAASTSLRKLSGRPETRLRVGDWRVLLTLETEARLIIRVLPRGRAYRD